MLLLIARQDAEFKRRYKEWDWFANSRSSQKNTLLGALLAQQYAPARLLAACQNNQIYAMEPAAGYLKDAADAGDTRALTTLADMIASPDRKPDQKALDRALALYKEAAIRGDKLAAYRLNRLHVSGLPQEQQKFVDAVEQFPSDYKGVCEFYNWTQDANDVDEESRRLADFAFVANVVLPV